METNRRLAEQSLVPGSEVGSRARLVESDLELSRTRRILRKMYLNVFSNKIILGLIILIEIGILCGVIYWKFGAKR